MARTFVPTAHLEIPGAPDTSYPFTMTAWVKADTTYSGSTFFGIGASSSASNYIALAHNSSHQGFFEINFNGATVDGWAAGGSGGTNTVTNALGWLMLTGIATSTSSRQMYVGNTAGTVDTAAQASSAFTAGSTLMYTIGGVYISTFSGVRADIAHCTFWQGVALTSGEIASLVAGQNPLNHVRASSIANYYPVTGTDSPELDYKSGRSMPLISAPAAAGSNPTVDPPPGLLAYSSESAMGSMQRL